MDLNNNYYPPDELLKKAEYFIERKSYYHAYETILNAARLYQQERSREGFRKSNALLCKIYSTKEEDSPYQKFPTNPYYNLDLAEKACKKAKVSLKKM